MVIDDFKFVRPVLVPSKANTVSTIDADTEFSDPIARERFKMIARGIAEISHVRGAPDHGHLTARSIVKPTWERYLWSPRF
jgi:hypothetical protein